MPSDITAGYEALAQGCDHCGRPDAPVTVALCCGAALCRDCAAAVSEPGRCVVCADG